MMRPGIGYIVYMHECGEILYIQGYGDSEDTNKYKGIGLPDTIKVCPRCGKPISRKPRKIIIKRLGEVDIDEVKRRYREAW